MAKSGDDSTVRLNITSSIPLSPEFLPCGFFLALWCNSTKISRDEFWNDWDSFSLPAKWAWNINQLDWQVTTWHFLYSFSSLETAVLNYWTESLSIYVYFWRKCSYNKNCCTQEYAIFTFWWVLPNCHLNHEYFSINSVQECSSTDEFVKFYKIFTYFIYPKYFLKFILI